MKFYLNFSFFNVIIINRKGSAISKIILPFNMFIPKDLAYVLFRFFILLDLIIFTEAIKILQKLTDHAQFKTIQAWRMIYRLNP